MIQIDDTIISQDVLDYDFVCNLNACKGACCVEGDAGAPIDEDELEILKEIFPKVRPFMCEEGIKSVEEQGLFVLGEDGEWETPLINKGECAYVIRSEKNITLCAIEQAYNAGEISWKKPISCHLYPVRLGKYSTFTAVNYNQWSICSEACNLGKSLQVPVYQFVKEALIRKFGSEWFDVLHQAATELKKENQQ